MNSPSGLDPVSSSNSLFAASSGSSPSSYSPFGIDHAPWSFFFQKGPPGWTRNTCKSAPHLLNISSPALNFAIVFPKLDLRSNAARYEEAQSTNLVTITLQPVQEQRPRFQTGADSAEFRRGGPALFQGCRTVSLRACHRHH